MTDFQRFYKENTVDKRFGFNETVNNAEALHRQIGLQSEIGEIINAFKYIVRPQSKHIDLINVKEEIGDCFFYLYSLRGCNFHTAKDNLHKVNSDGEKLTDDEKFVESIKIINACFLATCRILDWNNANEFKFLLIHSNLQRLANIWGFTFEEVINANIEKLNKRYAGGYSIEKDLNRNLEAER